MTLSLFALCEIYLVDIISYVSHVKITVPGIRA